MRYAIIADIHANLAAFTAVLEDIERRGGVDAIWCLGDVVGYGPEPRECLALLRELPHVCVAGNHDWAAAGKISTADFNPEAAAANRWTSRQLTAEDVRFLSDLPLSVQQEDFTLVHGTPREPIWEYLLSPRTAEENLSHFGTRYCLVGHSHRPLVLTCDGTGSMRHLLPGEPVVLARQRLFINPGAVGQPRDGDPRASYAIYDAEARRVNLHRVLYDIRATQAKMQSHQLPLRLAARLSYGL